MRLQSLTLLTLTCLSSLAGCATFNGTLPFSKSPKATAKNPAVQILCLWKPAEGRDPEGLPCRGFAGQVLFMSSRGALPLEVEGDVRIYVFDDQGSVEEQSKPLHQFDFDSGSWNAHLATSSVGNSYNLFVPYTRKGAHEAKCSLRVRLIPKSGGAPVFSDMATLVLEGHKPKPPTSEEVAARQQTILKQEQAAKDAAAQAMRKTTTISMNGKSETTTFAPPTQALAATTGTPATMQPSGIQLANYEESAQQTAAPQNRSTATDPQQQRIAQLESLVQDLLSKQQSSSRTAPPRELTGDEQVSPGKSATRSSRFQTKSISPSSDDADETTLPQRVTSVQRHPLEQGISDDEVDAPRKPVARSRRSRSEPSHPFDDDGDFVPQKKNRLHSDAMEPTVPTEELPQETETNDLSTDSVEAADQVTNEVFGDSPFDDEKQPKGTDSTSRVIRASME